MIFFETGLHDFLIDAQTTFTVRVAVRILDLCHQMLPENTETINIFLNDETQSVWSELKLNHLEAAFTLCGYSTIIFSLVFLFENIFFFMSTLFLVS